MVTTPTARGDNCKGDGGKTGLGAITLCTTQAKGNHMVCSLDLFYGFRSGVLLFWLNILLWKIHVYDVLQSSRFCTISVTLGLFQIKPRKAEPFSFSFPPEPSSQRKSPLPHHKHPMAVNMGRAYSTLQLPVTLCGVFSLSRLNTPQVEQCSTRG